MCNTFQHVSAAHMFASLSCVVVSSVTHPTQNVARHTRREWAKQSAAKGSKGVPKSCIRCWPGLLNVFGSYPVMKSR